jgi:hypothetical protein
MGATTNQIERHIEKTRDDLGSNIQELERKVKSATDWKQYFRNSALTLIGLAFGGGVLLASASGGERRHSSSSYSNSPQARQRDNVLETGDNIKDALLGVAAARFKNYVGEVVPGFKEQLARAEDPSRMKDPGVNEIPAPRDAS